MLDKTIEFKSVILMNKNDSYPVIYNLPEGFSYSFYNDGDELSWAEIEYSVLELEKIEDGINHVRNTYMKDMNELKRRMIFIVNDKGEKIATATAWYGSLDGKKIGVVHAVGVKPEYQGKGLGLAIISKMMEVFYTLDKDIPVWMDTQTWSYKAIGCYLKCGFKPLHYKTYNEVNNQYDEAIKILKDHIKDEVLEKFINLTIEE